MDDWIRVFRLIAFDTYFNSACALIAAGFVFVVCTITLPNAFVFGFALLVAVAFRHLRADRRFWRIMFAFGPWPLLTDIASAADYTVNQLVDPWHEIINEIIVWGVGAIVTAIVGYIAGHFTGTWKWISEAIDEKQRNAIQASLVRGAWAAIDYALEKYGNNTVSVKNHVASSAIDAALTGAPAAVKRWNMAGKKVAGPGTIVNGVKVSGTLASKAEAVANQVIKDYLTRPVQPVGNEYNEMHK